MRANLLHVALGLAAVLCHVPSDADARRVPRVRKKCAMCEEHRKIKPADYADVIVWGIATDPTRLEVLHTYKGQTQPSIVLEKVEDCTALRMTPRHGYLLYGKSTDSTGGVVSRVSVSRCIGSVAQAFAPAELGSKAPVIEPDDARHRNPTTSWPFRRLFTRHTVSCTEESSGTL